MKRYVSIFLTMCLIFSTTIPVSNLIVWAASQIDHAEIGINHAEIGVESPSDFGDIGDDNAGLKDADGGEDAGLGESDKDAELGEDGDSELGEPGKDAGGETGDGNTETEDGDIENGEIDKDGDIETDETDKDGDSELGELDKDDEGEIEEEEEIEMGIISLTNIENSISGHLWYHDDLGKHSVENYTVHLFDATDLHQIVDQVQTDMDGLYSFDNLPDGDYVVALLDIVNDGYSLTTEKTEENHFAIDHNLNSDMAYTDVIVCDGVAVENINAVLLLEAVNEQEFIRVYTLQQLEDIFSRGATSGGATNWSGERFVEIAFENLGSGVSTSTPPTGTTRTITIRSADGVQRNLTTTGTTSATFHFTIGTRNTLIIDDPNLHLVGNNPSQDVDGTLGGGLNITGGGTVELRRGTISNINARWPNSAISVSNNGTFIMRGGEIRNNRSNWGGGVYVTGSGGRFEMYDGIIRENLATLYGGGVDVNSSARFDMFGGIISDNVVLGSGGGGGVRVDSSGLFNMQGGIIERNTSTANVDFPIGGGVSLENSSSTFNMNGGIIRDNTAHRGGGVAIREGFFNLGTGRTISGRAPENQTGFVDNPTITNNTALGGGSNPTASTIGRAGGGGVFIFTGLGTTVNFQMHSGTISNNKSTFRGGGVFLNGASLNMLGGEIVGNSTLDNDHSDAAGGGVYLYDAGLNWTSEILMRGGAIRNNISRNGGGIARSRESMRINISGNAILSDNIAQQLGGAIFGGEPSSAVNVNGTSIGTNRANIIILDTVRFERNRSLQPSNGLLVSQVSLNSSVNNNIRWSGRNSANGILGDGTSFHLLNNHDIANLQGNPITDNFFDFFMVTEKHVDVFGNELDDVKDNTIQLANGESYESTLPTIEGFTALGHKWDSPPDNSGWDFMLGNPQSVQLTSSRTIYFVYRETVVTTTLTVSKEVTGGMGDQNREFEFTIIFADADKRPLAAQRFNYVGAIIEGSGAIAPANGVLVTDSEGKATFWLKHGQSIIIEDVALSSRVQIIVEDDIRYITAFIDSESDGEPVFEHDTTMQSMTENRAFLFINNREAPPASGLNIDHNGGLLIMVIGTISLWALLIFKILRRRRNFAKKHPIGCIG